jgi:alpha-amylase
MKKYLLISGLLVLIMGCKGKTAQDLTNISNAEIPFVWSGANLYFLLTDRFNNADISNDLNFQRTDETAVLRGFKGGDIKGITSKINEGYFTDLGINAIWMTPLVEQIRGSTDEGTGVTYGFHGYWTRDWTALDPNFGTMKELNELVETAHSKGIRIVLDAVINHTGPVTKIDPVWPEEWVRTAPKCEFNSYETTVTCTLVENLPDIRTESDKEVELPDYLVEKWKSEGRYELEMKELDAFFERTGYPRAPRFYIIKWLTDYIKEFGIDGYRADTVRHVEESVWFEFEKECQYSFDLWKSNNAEKVLDNNSFYIVGEVGGYDIIKAGTEYDFGDQKVNYYAYGFTSMINFEFKNNAHDDYEILFSMYSDALQGDLKGKGILNFVSSHDNDPKFDQERTKPYESATKLLLCPGTSQVYYGDESARSLIIEGANGDATLRSFMNWDEIENNDKTKEILSHWQKLGTFRAEHPSIGAGIHKMLSADPYIFKRTYTNENYNDAVIVGLDLALGEKEIDVANTFENGAQITDTYSGKEAVVENGKVIIETAFTIVLLEENK